MSSITEKQFNETLWRLVVEYNAELRNLEKARDIYRVHESRVRDISEQMRGIWELRFAEVNGEPALPETQQPKPEQPEQNTGTP